MKVLVISDSHGNVANLKQVMGFGKRIGASTVIHAGDWDNIESLDIVKSFGIPLFTVLGNADVSLSLKDSLEFELDGKKIGITHKPYDNKRYFANKKLDIIFNGHLHSKDETTWNGIRVVRPGAITKGNNFAVYDTETDKIEFVEDEEK